MIHAPEARRAHAGERRGLAILAALGVDLLFGEPRHLHPVHGMGRTVATAEQALGRFGRAGGLVTALGGAALWAATAHAFSCKRIRIDRRTEGRRRTARRPIAGFAWSAREGLALSALLSLRALLEAGKGVRLALAAGDLAEARLRLGRDLVSRTTADLSEGEVAAATIESLAENLGDAFVAPLFWYLAGGLPAAAIHRYLNTADAMVGYRTPRHREFGWASARADDLMNLIPARLTAFAIAAAAPVAGGKSLAATTVALRDAHLTPSPNAGWPMAAAAGALGIRLEKPGVYRLHAEARPACADDIGRAERLVSAAAILSACAAIGIAHRCRGSRSVGANER